MADEETKTDEELNEEATNPPTEFDTAFEEFAKEKSEPSPPADELDDEPKPDEPQPGEDKPKATDGTPGDEPPKEEEDPYAGWPEEAKAKFLELQETNEKLVHAKKSDSGRIAAHQRKVIELQRQLDAATQEKEAPSKQDIADAMANDEDWQQFSEEYPEIAKIIDKRMDATNKHVNEVMESQSQKIDDTLRPVVEKAQGDAMEELYGEVAKEYPTWQDAVKEQAYGDWITQQPPGVQNLADSDDPRDASTLLGMYDTYRVANGLETLKAPSEDPGKPDHESDSVVEKEASELEKRRQAQLESGTTVESKPAHINPNADSGENEFERAFNAFAARKEAKRQA